MPDIFVLQHESNLGDKIIYDSACARLLNLATSPKNINYIIFKKKKHPRPCKLVKQICKDCRVMGICRGGSLERIKHTFKIKQLQAVILCHG